MATQLVATCRTCGREVPVDPIYVRVLGRLLDAPAYKFEVHQAEAEQGDLDYPRKCANSHQYIAGEPRLVAV